MTTDQNPADLGTRPLVPSKLQESAWILGPKFLAQSGDLIKFEYEPCMSLPESVASPRRLCRTAACNRSEGIFTCLVKRLSRWSRILNALTRLIRFCRVWLDEVRQRSGTQHAIRGGEVKPDEAEKILFRQSQRESFPELFEVGIQMEKLPENHPLSGVVPFLDGRGLVRVGGRLRESAISFEAKHPVVLEGRHVITKRYVEHIHDRTPHQGRVITLSMVRLTGVFIVGGRQLIDKIVRDCVMCKVLRGKPERQLMSELPPKYFFIPPSFSP